MKAITIWQPYASLVAIGAKKYETRSWATKYRGPIAIHAAAKPVCDTLNGLIMGKEKYTVIRNALDAVPEVLSTGHTGSLPCGCVIATAELVNCWRIVPNLGTGVDTARYIPICAESMTMDEHAPGYSDYFLPTEREMLFGDWAPGRYAWELANVQLLPEPIPAKGQQGMWNWGNK